MLLASVRLPGVVAPMWARAVAFAIDLVIVWGLTGLVGTVASWPLHALGPWARTVGVMLAAAYAVAGHGPFGHGRTIGKLLLDLRVVGPDGTPPSWRRATVRFAPFGAFLFVNHGELPWLPVWGALALVGVVVFGIVVQIGLALADRPRHQLLHDLLAGTHVVCDPAPSVLVTRNAGAVRSRSEVSIVAAIVAVSATFDAGQAVSRHPRGRPIPDDLHQAITSLAGVVSADSRGTRFPAPFTTVVAGDPHRLELAVRVRGLATRCDEVFRTISTRINDAALSDTALHVVGIDCVSGFHLGLFASMDTSRGVSVRLRRPERSTVCAAPSACRPLDASVAAAPVSAMPPRHGRLLP